MKISKKLLKKEYLLNKLTSSEIAGKYGVTDTWINVLRKNYFGKSAKWVGLLEKLKRTKDSISRKASYLTLTRK